jgi:hypothetical protein
MTDREAAMTTIARIADLAASAPRAAVADALGMGVIVLLIVGGFALP